MDIPSIPCNLCDYSKFMSILKYFNPKVNSKNITKQNIKDAFKEYVPNMYQPEEIIKKANELYSYVSEKK